MALRFLLLEDNPLDAEVIHVTLMDGGIDCELLRVTSHHDFVTALETSSFDLILADYSLPGFDGIAALEIARCLCPDLPFIFVSASLGEELAIEMLKRGATDYVLKQRLRRLVPSVHRALREAKERHSFKQVETALRESEHRYRTLFESIDQGFCICEMLFDQSGEPIDYRFLEVNPAFEMVTGLQQAVGKTMRELVPTLEAQWFEIYGRVVLTGEPARFEQQSLAMNRWFDVSAFRVEAPQSRKFALLFTNITDRKRTETEKERLLQQAQAARIEAEQANQVKDEFLAVLSHELRSPLNPILGWTKLLQTGKFDQQKTKQALDIIERNAKQQTQLIDDLLDISRILRGKLALNEAPVDLGFTIESALENVRLAAEAKGIHIETMLDSTVPPIFGDAGRLQQIVWNLLSNALKFTPTGGRVDVVLRQLDLEAELQIKDTGKGITPEFLPYVFESFRQEDGRTTRRFGGLGLGLAIVRQLTELHGGTVCVESLGEGTGATFTVRLPLMRQSSTPAPSAPVDSAATTMNVLQGSRILVVDDEVDMRDLVVDILEQAGAIVQTVPSAALALAVLDTFQPDMLVSDIGMPEMDGYDLIEQIRKRAPDSGGKIPAIALTAYATEQDQQQAIVAGFQRHLAKPTEPQTLVAAILELLRQ